MVGEFVPVDQADDEEGDAGADEGAAEDLEEAVEGCDAGGGDRGGGFFGVVGVREVVFGWWHGEAIGLPRAAGR